MRKICVNILCLKRRTHVYVHKIPYNQNKRKNKKLRVKMGKTLKKKVNTRNLSVNTRKLNVKNKNIRVNYTLRRVNTRKYA